MKFLKYTINISFRLPVFFHAFCLSAQHLCLSLFQIFLRDDRSIRQCLHRDRSYAYRLLSYDVRPAQTKGFGRVLLQTILLSGHFAADSFYFRRRPSVGLDSSLRIHLRVLHLHSRRLRSTHHSFTRLRHRSSSKELYPKR